MNARLPLFLVLATLTAACGNKKDGDAAPAGSGTAAAGTASAAASGVDPKIDALAKAVLPCKAYDSSFDFSCPAMKAWSDAKDDFNEGKADASLVAMIGDANEKIRYLGANKLRQYGKAFKTDKTMAAALVTAAEKEKTKFAGFEVGAVVGQIAVRDTGLFDRVSAMVKKHDVPDLRRGIVSNLLFNNQDFDPAYNLIRDTVKDHDKAVSQQALSAFWTGGTRKGEQTCQLYFDNLENPNEELAAEANNYLAWFGQCSAKYDPLLDSIEKRVKGGAVGSSSYVSAARHVCEDAKANDKQKKRAADLGRKIAEKKDFKGWIRASALEAVMKCDTSNGGKSFVGKFKKDPEKSVADKATELLGKK